MGRGSGHQCPVLVINDIVNIVVTLSQPTAPYARHLSTCPTSSKPAPKPTKKTEINLPRNMLKMR